MSDALRLDQDVRLSDDVVVEPLVRSWWASPHVVAPATSAMFAVNAHLPIMQAYLKAPQVHEQACAKPELRGGRFLDVPRPDYARVKRLHDRTAVSTTTHAEFAAAVATLTATLSSARGESLRGVYDSLPVVLRGRVELVYDTAHRAGFRFLERALYSSALYRPDDQSLLVSRPPSRRPFVGSTPRVGGEGTLEIVAPFRSPAVGALARLRREPHPLGEVAESLGVSGDDLATLTALVEPASTPPRAGDHRPSAPRLRYVGHACVVIETAAASIVVDPAADYAVSADGNPRGFDDLPARIDAVLVTHMHADHLNIEVLLQLRHRVDTVVVPAGSSGALQDPSPRLLLEHLGFSVVELGELDRIDVGDVSVVGIPFLGEHADLDIRSKLGYAVKTAGRTVLTAADSKNITPELYDVVRDVVGQVDTLFLGMECEGAPLSWLYGPLFTERLERRIDESRRLAGSDQSEALDLVDRLGCSTVYVYAMGEEPWMQHITANPPGGPASRAAESFVAAARDRGLDAEYLRAPRVWAPGS